MRIEIVDIGPHDGLQNEDETLSPEVGEEPDEDAAREVLPGERRRIWRS